MGKYRTTRRRDEAKKQGPEPIWRGIGCLLIILVPLLAYALAEITMPFFLAQGLVPRELLFTPDTPEILRFLPVVAQIYRLVFGRYAILAILILTFVYLIFIGGIISFFYALLYRIAAPSRYGPMDAPPPRIKVKKYKR